MYKTSKGLSSSLLKEAIPSNIKGVIIKIFPAGIIASPVLLPVPGSMPKTKIFQIFGDRYITALAP